MLAAFLREEKISKTILEAEISYAYLGQFSFLLKELILGIKKSRICCFKKGKIYKVTK
jgi:hypothetical protein